MMSLEYAIKQWADTLWPNRTLSSRFRKLCEEVGELGAALMDGSNVEQVRGEIGDVGILLVDIAAIVKNYNGEGKILKFCIIEKFREVKKRNYDSEGNRDKTIS